MSLAKYVGSSSSEADSSSSVNVLYSAFLELRALV